MVMARVGMDGRDWGGAEPFGARAVCSLGNMDPRAARRGAAIGIGLWGRQRREGKDPFLRSRGRQSFDRLECKLGCHAPGLASGMTVAWGRGVLWG